MHLTVQLLILFLTWEKLNSDYNLIQRGALAWIIVMGAKASDLEAFEPATYGVGVGSINHSVIRVL